MPILIIPQNQQERELFNAISSFFLYLAGLMEKHFFRSSIEMLSAISVVDSIYLTTSIVVFGFVFYSVDFVTI